jgi:hypothetical protein
MTISFGVLGFPPCWRAYFLLCGQKKVAKEKATPGSAPGKPGSLRYSAGRAACLNSPAAQTRQADCPRPACVAQRLSRGPKASWLNQFDQKLHSHGQPGKKPKNEIHRSNVDALPGPLGGAEQRRKAGGLRRGLFEGRSPEFRSRPACRVAQGTGAAGTDLGVAFSLATFFWPHKRKYARQQGGTPSQPKPRSQKQRTQPC